MFAKYIDDWTQANHGRAAKASLQFHPAIQTHTVGT